MPESFRKIINTEFSEGIQVYYELIWRRPLGVRANFASPLDGKRN